MRRPLHLSLRQRTVNLQHRTISSSLILSTNLSIPGKPPVSNPIQSSNQQQQRRTFIPFSSATSALSALSALTQPNKPLNYHATRILPYPQPALYKIVSDIESYPHFLPLVLGAKVWRWQDTDSDGSRGRVPALATLKIGLTEGLQKLPLGLGSGSGSSGGGMGLPTTASFLSSVYCVPARGLVEAVAGEQRSSNSLTAQELESYQNSFDHSTATRESATSEEASDVGPQLFRVCRTQWLLTPEKGSQGRRTEVDLRIEIEWKQALLSAFTQAAAPKIAESVIEAFERRAREVVQR